MKWCEMAGNSRGEADLLRNVHSTPKPMRSMTICMTLLTKRWLPKPTELQALLPSVTSHSLASVTSHSLVATAAASFIVLKAGFGCQKMVSLAYYELDIHFLHIVSLTASISMNAPN